MNTMYNFYKFSQTLKSVARLFTKNLMEKMRAVGLIVVIALTIGLVGCGQKGDLYLPSTITTPTLDTNVGQTDKTGQDF